MVQVDEECGFSNTYILVDVENRMIIRNQNK